MPSNSNSGFTIIELMIVITVIAILAVIAVPSFSDTLERKRIQGIAESVKAEFEYARSEAIKQSCEDGTILSFVAGAAWQINLTRCDATTKSFSGTSSGVTLSNIAFAGNDLTFNSRRGSVDENQSITFSTDNYDLQVRTINNRVIDICYPAASTPIPTYGQC
jgi:type IV fimbrial biogenesis protein FimT